MRFNKIMIRFSKKIKIKKIKSMNRNNLFKILNKNTIKYYKNQNKKKIDNNNLIIK